MKIYREISLGEFDAWSGGEETLRIVGEADKLNELEDLLIQDEPADGWTETALNDMLRFEDKYIFDALGINPDDYKDDEDEGKAERNPCAVFGGTCNENGWCDECPKVTEDDEDADENDDEIRAEIIRLLGLEAE